MPQNLWEKKERRKNLVVVHWMWFIVYPLNSIQKSRKIIFNSMDTDRMEKSNVFILNIISMCLCIYQRPNEKNGMAFTNKNSHLVYLVNRWINRKINFTKCETETRKTWRRKSNRRMMMMKREEENAPNKVRKKKKQIKQRR